MSVAFPGQTPLTSHADFAKWYQNLLAQTLWNFHDVSALQIQRMEPQQFRISFVVDWYGVSGRAQCRRSLDVRGRVLSRFPERTSGPFTTAPHVGNDGELRSGVGGWAGGHPRASHRASLARARCR